jgi:hypothetical protein
LWLRIPNPSFVRILFARVDFSFGEPILDIADKTADDWSYHPKDQQAL